MRNCAASATGGSVRDAAMSELQGGTGGADRLNAFGVYEAGRGIGPQDVNHPPKKQPVAPVVESATGWRMFRSCKRNVGNYGWDNRQETKAEMSAASAPPLAFMSPAHGEQGVPAPSTRLTNA